MPSTPSRQPHNIPCALCKFNQTTCTHNNNAPDDVDDEYDATNSATADDYEIANWIIRIQQAQLFTKFAPFGRIGVRRLFDVSEQLSEN